jgi:signal transduction histidine kinase
MSARVRTLSMTATLLEAAQVMHTRGIGCLVVTEGERPVGIITERDVMREVAKDPTSWCDRPAATVMSHPLRIIGVDASTTDAISALRRHGVRRLPVVSSQGTLAGIVTQSDLLFAAHRQLQDYTVELERVVAERTVELRASEQGRDDLVDLTVHDIKNSLTVIDSAVEMMMLEPIEAVMTLPLLRRATSRIGHLVCALLDVNRLESGAMPLKVTDVPWSTVCEPVMAETGLLGQVKGLVFNRSGESHAIVRCDPTLIERVLLNLLDNAINAAPDGRFLVRVGNRGRGIPPDLLPTLFAKYRQAPDARPARRLGGWGLGLTFCRLAVERHGGSIRAISPYIDGEGVAFEFDLPADPK